MYKFNILFHPKHAISIVVYFRTRTAAQWEVCDAWIPWQMSLRKLEFDSREEDFYQALYTQSQSQFDTYVKSGTVVNNYAHIFDLLIRLRQVLPPQLQVFATQPSSKHANRILRLNSISTHHHVGVLNRGF